MLLTADKPFSLTEADHYVITAVIILLAVGAFACRAQGAIRRRRHAAESARPGARGRRFLHSADAAQMIVPSSVYAGPQKLVAIDGTRRRAGDSMATWRHVRAETAKVPSPQWVEPG